MIQALSDDFAKNMLNNSAFENIDKIYIDMVFALGPNAETGQGRCIR